MIVRFSIDMMVVGILLSVFRNIWNFFGKCVRLGRFSDVNVVNIKD